MASQDARELIDDSGALAANLQGREGGDFGGPAPATIVRVFPIRISNSTLALAHKSVRAHARGSEANAAKTTPVIPPVPANPVDSPVTGSVSPTSSVTPLVSATHSIEEASGSGKRYITTRFSRLPGDGSDDSIEPSAGQKVYRCEDEPIHIPGAIQRFGALIAMRENEKGEFLVRIVSENSENVTGFKPEELFKLRCFSDLLNQKQRDEFTTRVRAMLDDDSNINQDIFVLSLTSLLRAPVQLFCAMHKNKESDLIICEFELEHDIFNPARSVTDSLPQKPAQVTNDQNAKAERLAPTTSGSRHLRSVSIARKAGSELGPMDLFRILTEIQGHLSNATTLPALLDTVVGLVYELTGFHRTMIYQFDENASGMSIL